MLAFLVLEALRHEALGRLVDVGRVLRGFRLEGVRPNPQDTVAAPHRSTDVTAAPGWDNCGMRLDPFRSDRDRRTATVVELLRRRAEQRRARDQDIPPALSETIADPEPQPRRAAGDEPSSAPR